MRTSTNVREDLRYLEESWPLLVGLRVPGSRKRWAERPPTTAQAAARAAVDRLEGVGVPKPAPADVGVLDLLRSLVEVAADVHDAVQAASLVPWVRPQATAAVDPRPYLDYTSRWLVEAQEHDEISVPWVDDRIGPVVRDVARLLGDIRDDQLLHGICPWCYGRTVDAPAGGERTLRVHYPSARDEGDEPLVVCHGIECSPPASATSTWWRTLPAWPEREWDWLAKRILHALPERERVTA